MIDLKNKKIILSGSGGFFGNYFLKALVEAGAVVIAIDRPGGDGVSESLKNQFLPKQVFFYEADLYDDESTRKIYNQIILEHPNVDGLVNNAFDFSLKTGFNDESGRLERATYDQLKSSFDSGIYWAIRASQIFGAQMKKNGSGSIVNIASMYGVVVPNPDLYEGTTKFNPPGYSMAKAGLIQFTKYSAAFMGPEIRVNSLSPGAIPNLEKTTYNAVKTGDPILERLTQKTLLKKLGHPSDLVGGLIFLLSDSASYITGHNLVIDGGLIVT